MQAFQWSKLPRIDAVQHGLDSSDFDCLREVADVLRRHRKEWRFGVNLLHSHFEMSDDEVLVETSDPVDQSLWIRPVPKTTVADQDVVETAWCLATGEPQMGCVPTAHAWLELRASPSAYEVSTTCGGGRLLSRTTFGAPSPIV